jgi:hypothetical protein
LTKFRKKEKKRGKQVLKKMEEAHDGCLAPGSRVRPGVHLLMLLTQVVVGSYLVVAKIALSGGVQQLVFAVYRDAFGICLLIPFAYFYELYANNILP